MRPSIEHLVVSLALGDDAALIELVDLEDLLLRVADDPALARRCDQVVGGERQAAASAIAEAEAVHIVQKIDRLGPSQCLVTIGDHFRQFTRPHGNVVEQHSIGQSEIENDAADGGIDYCAGLSLRLNVGLQSTGWRELDLDPGVRVQHTERIRQLHFIERRERHPFALAAGERHRQIVAAHDHILRRADDRRAVGRAEDVVGRHHQRVGLNLGLDRERQVDGHLVAVEVGVEPLANQGMELDCVPLDQHRLESLNAHAVQRRSAIQEHRVIADHLFEDIPHFVVLPLEHLLGALDRVGMAEFLEPPNDERLEQFQRDLLRQPTLVQPQRRPDDNNGASRIIDALAEQVLAEPALLPLDHVGERLERPIARSEHRALAAIVIEQRIDRLLEHPLFVADDDFRRIEINQLLEPVVAVDDAAIEIVQVAGGEIARVEQHERPQVRRDDRNHVEHHPLGFVVAVTDRLDNLEPVDEVLFLLLRRGFVQLFAQRLREVHQVELDKQLADGLGAHVGLEGAFTVLFAGGAIFFFGEQLPRFERSVLGVNDHVILEVDHLLQARGLHVEQVAQAARHRLEEPDMHHRGGKLDMAHPLAAHAAVSDLHAAAVADHPLVFHPAILAAGTFPVFLRAKDALAEEAVLFGTVSAVVDRLGLLDFAE